MRQESIPGRGAASPVRRSVGLRAVFSAVETLEIRRHLSASLVRPVVKTAVSPVASIGVRHVGRGPLKILPKSTVLRAVAAGESAGTNAAVAVATAPFSPAEIRHFYGVDALGFGGTAGTGAGQTIAIIDAYNQPDIRSDLATFDNTFGLAAPPGFVVESQTGSTTALPANNMDAGLETSLDVEWAHAMAPAANLLLIECNSLSSSDLFNGGVALANRTAGVSVVSMSFGLKDSSGENTFDRFFQTPGVTYVASTGDDGAAQTAYPATSPYVVGVGGTRIATSDALGSYGTESVWNDSSTGDGATGGGISVAEPKPGYQSGTYANGTVTSTTTARTASDVSFLADPETGVYVYDTNESGGGGFTQVGGTSLSAPCWAGLIADADQGRALIGATPLSGFTQTLPRVYQLPQADFHDITVGNNNYQSAGGYSAGVGYDLPTGRGTPVANTLIPDLAGGTDSGTAFVDKNGNGVFDGTDTALANVTVYVDVNNDGVFDTGDLSTTSHADGTFAFSDVVGGLAVREVVPGGYVSTTGGAAGFTGYGAVSGLALGNFPTTIAAPAGGTTAYSFTLRLDPTGTIDQIFANTDTTAAPAYTVAKRFLTTLTFAGNAGDNAFTLDLTNGNPLPVGGVTFNGSGQTTADAVNVVAAAGGSSVSFTPGTSPAAPTNLVTVGGLALTYTGAEALAYTGGAGSDTVSVTGNTLPLNFAGGGGADTLTVTGGVYNPPADLGADGTSLIFNRNSGATTFSTSQHLSALNLSAGATAAFTTAGAVLRTSGLSIDTASGSYVDLNTSGLIYDYTTATPDAAVTALLAGGYAAGAWNGLGIRSTAAANDTTKKHALGNGEAAAALNLAGAATGTFLGETVDATTYLVRYTGYGDSDLNGAVSFSDFLRLQGAFGQTTDSFTSGNFNYDAKTTFADFLLLQGNFGLVT